MTLSQSRLITIAVVVLAAAIIVPIVLFMFAGA
jgi:hypothetical protein